MDLVYYFLPSLSISLHLYLNYFIRKIYIVFVITFLLFTVPFALSNLHSEYLSVICNISYYVLTNKHNQYFTSTCVVLFLFRFCCYLPQFQYSHPVCCTSGHPEHFRTKAVMDFVNFLSPFLQAQHLGTPHPLDYFITHIYLQNLQLHIWGSH